MRMTSAVDEIGMGRLPGCRVLADSCLTRLMDAGEIICGIDEAGRGPLAGPVVAAAVILDKKRQIRGLNDSKQLTEERRDILAVRIKERAIAWAVGWASSEEIDAVNIRQANFLAMRRAFEG